MPKLINLTLRDGQQSTLDAASWIFEPRDYAKIITASEEAGFDGIELSGGQSFQIAIGRGYNPFMLLGSISHAIKSRSHGQDFELQMLFRGANALGFRHYDKDLLEIILKEFIKLGITKIRCFDALNDIQNLELPEEVKSADVTLEGALCFAHYTSAPERYSDDYYCEYTKALLEAGYNAIGIKDMSGQLTAERVSTLVPALLEILSPQNIPLSLHCHSTNAEASKAAIAEALKYDIAAIETVEGSLSGGSSHHPLSVVAPQLIKDEASYHKLTERTNALWGERPDRKDQDIPQELKEQLCAAGVPGGAMPFVVSDLKQQEPTIRAKYLSSPHTPNTGLPENDFSAIIDLFLNELKRVCQDAGLPLLVTPTADICCKQAIANLAFGSDPYADGLAERYLSKAGQPNPDTRYAKLILGYYGELKAYDKDNSVYGPSEDVTFFFQGHNALQLKKIKHHPSESPNGGDLREAQQSAWQLIQKLGAEALSFASFDQLSILYALKPAAAVQSNDPIEKAIQIYLARAENAKIDGRGQIFPEYEELMQPIFSHLSALFVLNPGQDPLDILDYPLEKFNPALCQRLYDIYIDLPLWTRVTKLNSHLTKLMSSVHVEPKLLEAVRHVSDSLTQLDLRPSRHEKSNMNEALKRFSQITIAELVSSLALVNSFVNDIAKYATNPPSYAEQSIGFPELSNFIQQAKSRNHTEGENAWVNHLQQSLTGKYLRLESDLLRRTENWKV